MYIILRKVPVAAAAAAPLEAADIAVIKFEAGTVIAVYKDNGEPVPIGNLPVDPPYNLNKNDGVLINKMVHLVKVNDLDLAAAFASAAPPAAPVNFGKLKIESAGKLKDAAAVGAVPGFGDVPGDAGEPGVYGGGKKRRSYRTKNTRRRKH